MGGRQRRKGSGVSTGALQGEARPGSSGGMASLRAWHRSRSHHSGGPAAIAAAATHRAVPMTGSAGMPPAKGSPAAASFLDSWELMIWRAGGWMW